LALTIRLAVTREAAAGETRVAVVPETVTKLVARGCDVTVQSAAGLGSSIADAAFEKAGARVVADAVDALRDADLVLTVGRPSDEAVESLKSGAMIVGLLEPHGAREWFDRLAQRNVSAFALELVPRITRAQAMDSLSSQANLAGYRAVIEAAAAYGGILPMLTTAAGTVPPAKAFVMGAGVAGLQAIATARRLGAVVTATDVRPAAKEQVESLGAKFVAVEDDAFKAAEAAGGYAKPMSESYQAKQATLVSEHIQKQDMVITTALIPGHRAPRLVTADQVASMRPGSVIVDMAVEQGGNVEGSTPDAVVEIGGVKIIGYANLARRLPAVASALYARNVLAFAGLLLSKEGALAPNMDDEILKAACVTRPPSVAPAEPT
jgi:NAD(P) transhydrogenase subunit alpha